jgi:hypothetical protein
MEASTLLMFQPPGWRPSGPQRRLRDDRRSDHPGDPSPAAHGIAIISLHNHLPYESPRLSYMHFWGTGNATTLAQGLRAGPCPTTRLRKAARSKLWRGDRDARHRVKWLPAGHPLVLAAELVAMADVKAGRRPPLAARSGLYIGGATWTIRGRKG